MAANETSKMCPHCYTPMKLKIAGYPMGSAFIKERVHVDIYSCPPQREGSLPLLRTEQCI